MDLQLTGKIALVTGSTAGIGAEIARVFAREGAYVVVHGRDDKRANDVLASIESGNARHVLGDLSSDQAAARVFSEAEACFGGVDVLVNNAGVYAERHWFDTTPETWRAYYEADVLSAVRLILAAIPGMKSRGWGRIIQVATGLATTPGPVMPDYAAAKAALVNVSVSLAKALAGTGITSNTISPGLITTDGVEQALRRRAEASNWGSDWQIIQRNWMQQILDAKYTDRLGTPSDVAALVAFVSSPLAGYIQGANLRVDGGLCPSIN
jgi:NAD(P)-dependent dehydrogenase (short-subunit alcohol dehydrogenase family)